MTKTNTAYGVMGAQRRAQLVALLQSEGAQTRENIEQKLGWSHGGVWSAADGAVKAGLIGVRKEGLKNVYFATGALGALPQEPQEVVVAHAHVAKPVKRVNGHAPVHPAHEAPGVELVVAGMVVVFGRNPANGRLRITLDPV